MTIDATALAELPAGFDDPVHDAQAVFRRLLDAMARPGRLVALPPRLGLPALPGEAPPAAAAILLALADADVRLHVDARAAALARWLRFHTGVRLAGSVHDADWLLVDASDADGAWLAALPAGDDESPHTAPTVLVAVPSLAVEPGAGIALTLTGPGIEQPATLHAGGLDASFWRQRIAQQAHFPCGADLVLCCGARFAALPRSTRVQLAA